MLFTKECDYAVRIFRALSNVEKMNVQDIAKKEHMTVSITYKITRKLEQAGLLQSFRGANGGYAVARPLNELTLYDIFQVIDKDLFITECVNHEFNCSRNTKGSPCMVHKEFLRLQKLVYEELKSRTLEEIMTD